MHEYQHGVWRIKGQTLRHHTSSSGDHGDGAECYNNIGGGDGGSSGTSCWWWFCDNIDKDDASMFMLLGKWCLSGSFTIKSPVG